MFAYRDLYKQLGNLFYAVAATDGRVGIHEKEALNDLVLYGWKHFTSLHDEFGEDMANMIFYQFDIDEEHLRSAESAYKAFEDFYDIHHSSFDEFLKEKIISSARRIAESSRSINSKEMKCVMRLRHLLLNKYPANDSKMSTA